MNVLNQIENPEQSKALDSIIEELKGEYSEDILKSDLCQTTVFRLKAPRILKDAEILEQSEGLVIYTEDQIGKKFGGGHFQISYKIFEIDQNGKKKNKSWPKHFFSLGETYNTFANQNKRDEKLKNLQEEILINKSLGGESGPQISELLKEMREERQFFLKLILEQKPQAPQGPSSLELLTALSPLIVQFMQAQQAPKSDFQEKLLLKLMSDKENSSEKILSMFSQGLEMGKVINGAAQAEKTNLEMVMENIPMIAEGMKPLLSGVGQMFAKRAVKQYAPQINAIKSSPEATQKLFEEMSKKLSPEEIKKAQALTGITPNSDKVEL